MTVEAEGAVSYVAGGEAGTLRYAMSEYGEICPPCENDPPETRDTGDVGVGVKGGCWREVFRTRVVSW